jgi:hypothetical protein
VNDSNTRLAWWNLNLLGFLINFLVFVVAVFAIVIAYKALRLTEQQVHIGQRGYLVWHGATVKSALEPDKPAEASIRLTNSGQTPAKDVAVTYNLAMPKSNDCPPAQIALPTQRMPAGYVGADKYLEFTVRTLDPLSASDIANITKEDVGGVGNLLVVVQHPTLCFWGLAEYTDVFGGHNRTEFCSAYNAYAKGFANCFTHNTLN